MRGAEGTVVERACQVRPHLDYAQPTGPSKQVQPAPRSRMMRAGIPAGPSTIRFVNSQKRLTRAAQTHDI